MSGHSKWETIKIRRARRIDSECERLQLTEDPPLLPTPDLANWVLDERVEPCSQCGGGHQDRTKFVCADCNRLLCVKRVRCVDGEWRHMVVFRDVDKAARIWCGPVDVCGEWEEIVPRLTRIVDDLE